MPTVDMWHGYSNFVDIHFHDQFGSSHQACNVKPITYGSQCLNLSWETSPFRGPSIAHLHGDGWRREVIPVTDEQAPYLWLTLTEHLFEVLVRCRLAKVSEWSNFYYCLGQKRYGSKFVIVDAPGGHIRFLNPEWKVQSEIKKIPKPKQKRIDRANGLLLQLKEHWQVANCGWLKWRPEHFGLKR